MEKPDISIVIPVYNEEDNLAPLAEGLVAVLEKLNKAYEVIFVDDASKDRSLQVLKTLGQKYPAVRIVRFTHNSGQSAAFDAGFKLAKADIVVTMDADLQYDPADIPKLLDKLKNHDVVCGWRKHRLDPWIKLVSTRIANAVRNKVSAETIKDTGCSLKAFKRHYLIDLKMYKGMHRFFPTLLKMQGAKVTEVAVRHLPRKFGRSKYNIRNRLFRSFLDLLVVTWMKKRNLNYKMEVIK